MREDQRFSAEVEYGAVVLKTARGGVGGERAQGGDEGRFLAHLRVYAVGRRLAQVCLTSASAALNRSIKEVREESEEWQLPI